MQLFSNTAMAPYLAYRHESDIYLSIKTKEKNRQKEFCLQYVINII